MLVMDCMADILRREGIDTMFCFPTTPIIKAAVAAGIATCTIVLNNSTMAIEIPHMQLSHERYGARDLGGNYAALARELGCWSERIEEPDDVGNAILRAKWATEDGRTCLLEFITSAETAFSNRS